jgi:iron complex transport system ATP-binding protein
MLKAENVTFSYTGHPVLHDLSIELERGDLSAIVGPNGSGKTTLLRLLCGFLRPSTGQVWLDSRTLASMERQLVALRIAAVPQDVIAQYPFTVRELVEMGRTPHLHSARRSHLDATDREAVESAMRATATQDLADRPVTQLSGGERQRAIIAIALAQEPRYLLLDEPTTHLDIRHQVEIMELLAQLNRERGLAILATMHDLNLAALYFRKLFLMDGGQLLASGTADEVLSEGRLQSVFHTSIRITRHPSLDLPQISLLPGATKPKAQTLSS